MQVSRGKNFNGSRRARDRFSSTDNTPCSISFLNWRAAAVTSGPPAGSDRRLSTRIDRRDQPHPGTVRALAHECIPEILEFQPPGIGPHLVRHNTQLLDQLEAVFLNLVYDGFDGGKHLGAKGFGLDTIVNLCCHAHENKTFFIKVSLAHFGIGPMERTSFFMPFPLIPGRADFTGAFYKSKIKACPLFPLFEPRHRLVLF